MYPTRNFNVIIVSIHKDSNPIGLNTKLLLLCGFMKYRVMSEIMSPKYSVRFM